MSQNNISFDGSMTGASMLDERLTPLLNNLYSSNSGSTRPSYLQAGGTWFDSPNGKLMLFNGISEIPLSTLMTATETEAVTGSDDTKAMTPLGTTKVVGIGKYYVTRTYAEDDVVLNVDDGEIELYQSLIDNNVGNPLTDATKWKKVSLGGAGSAGGEIGDMGFAPLGIDESLNLRRYLNGQVISQAQFVSFTTKVKSAVALFPSLATTEANWQAEVTNSKLGQCGKFVIDDTAGTIRLPCVVNAQGLLGLSGIGNLVNESLPNITGGFSQDDNLANNNVSGAFINSGKQARGLSVSTDEQGKIVEFDASRSSTTYQDNAPVQQEAVQYPYYIQVATGVEETLPAIREYEINTPFFFGQSMYSENDPYNASWLESMGQYNASSVYPDFWTQLTGVELNGSLNVGDTIEIGGKTYVKRGLSVVLSTGTITDYDFVVNQNDQTFRLPLLNGDRVLVKKYVNGTDWYNLYSDGWCEQGGYVSFSSGATQTINLLKPYADTDYTITKSFVFELAAIYEASIKQSSKTTESFQLVAYDKNPAAYWQTCGYAEIPTQSDYTELKGLYYYVGDTVQDASLINAGAVLGQLSDKISRTAASDKETVVGWGMPDYSAGITINTTSYTAPANGWLKVNVSQTNDVAFLKFGNVEVYYGGGGSTSHNNCGLLPVAKNTTLTGTNPGGILMFFPCIGA